MTEDQFATLLVRISNGETMRSVLAEPGWPTLNQTKHHLRKNPALQARLDAAKPLSGKALVRAKFDEILRAIECGSTAESAVENFGGTGVSFFAVVRSDSDLREKFIAATAKREAGERAIGKSAAGRWTEADFDAALDALRAKPRTGMSRVLADALPSATVVLDKAKRDSAFAQRLREVIGERAKRRAGMKRQPARHFATGLLLQACKKLDVYATAYRAAATLDPADRDDVISEIILAVLEDRLSPDEIKSKGARLGRRAVFGDRWRPESLDIPLHATSNADNLGDTIAAPCGINFY